MLGGRSIRLARIFGIRVGVDVSWFVALFLIIWIEASNYRNLFPGHDTKAFLLAVAGAFLLFLSILLHVLGPAAVALGSGIGVVGLESRAIAGGKAGARTRATRLPAIRGRGLGYRVGAGGIYLAVSGASVALGVWMLFIAAMVTQAARSLEVHSDITARIQHLRVADVMD